MARAARGTGDDGAPQAKRTPAAPARRAAPAAGDGTEGAGTDGGRGARGAQPEPPGGAPSAASTEWLLLVYRIPSEPTRLRAGVWRKLKGIGAIYLQGSTAAIPASKTTERAMRGLRAEIIELGGTGYLFRANAAAGSPELRDAFNAARDDEYEEIIDRSEDFLFQVNKEYEADHFTYAELEENEVDLTKLRGWLDRIRSRDVLGASKLSATTEILERCEQALEDYAARVYAEEGEASA